MVENVVVVHDYNASSDVVKKNAEKARHEFRISK